MSQASSINVDFINPFIEATTNVLETMAFLKPKPLKPFLKTPHLPLGDVTGMIGFASENCTGSMALVFPRPCVLEIVSKMLGEQFPEINDEVVDCVGELTNMVSGGAKKGLGEKGYRFEMAIPSMVMGEGHTIAHKTTGPVVVIPFEIPSGKFYIEACFQSR